MGKRVGGGAGGERGNDGFHAGRNSRMRSRSSEQPLPWHAAKERSIPLLRQRGGDVHTFNRTRRSAGGFAGGAEKEDGGFVKTVHQTAGNMQPHRRAILSGKNEDGAFLKRAV